MITKKYLLNLWHGTYKKREHWRIIFFFEKRNNVILHWRSAFKNDLVFDYHMIIRMVIILKWNPSKPKAIENCQICSGNYISALLLFAYFLEVHLLKLLNWIPFLYHSGLTNCINSSWLHFELTGFFTLHKLAVFALERYGVLPSCFQN